MARKAPTTRVLSPELASAWQHLIEIITGVRDLTPWDFVSPDAILGVRDPVSGEIDWCTAIGHEGEVFGVAIYPGDAGFTTLHRILNDEVDEFDGVIAQRAVTLTFESARGLSAETKQLMKQLGRKFRGSHSWPQLLVHEPSLLASLPDDETQLVRIANALCGFASLVPWASEDPDGGASEELDHAWVTTPPFGAGDRVLSPLPKVTPPVIELPPFDQLAAARLRQSATPRKGQWYLDWFCGITTIEDAEGGRPYFLAHLVCLDLTTGIMLYIDAEKVAEAVSGLQAIVLREAEKHGLPEVLRVRRKDLHAALQPFANALAVPLELEPELSELSHQLNEQLMNVLMR